MKKEMITDWDQTGERTANVYKVEARPTVRVKTTLVQTMHSPKDSCRVFPRKEETCSYEWESTIVWV